jgi:hypothetical protein
MHSCIISRSEGSSFGYSLDVLSNYFLVYNSEYFCSVLSGFNPLLVTPCENAVGQQRLPMNIQLCQY